MACGRELEFDRDAGLYTLPPPPAWKKCHCKSCHIFASSAAKISDKEYWKYSTTQKFTNRVTELTHEQHFDIKPANGIYLILNHEDVPYIQCWYVSVFVGKRDSQHTGSPILKVYRTALHMVSTANIFSVRRLWACWRVYPSPEFRPHRSGESSKRIASDTRYCGLVHTRAIPQRLGM